MESAVATRPLLKRISPHPSLTKWLAPGVGLLFILLMFITGEQVFFAPLLFVGVDPSFIAEQPLLAKLIITTLILTMVLWSMYRTQELAVVFDGGDYLLYKLDGREQELPFSAIQEVSYNRFSHRITIHLQWPGPFGDDLTFFPNAQHSYFFKPVIVEELRARIEQAQVPA